MNPQLEQERSAIPFQENHLMPLHSAWEWEEYRELNCDWNRTKTIMRMRRVQRTQPKYIRKKCKRIIFIFSNSCGCCVPSLIKSKISIFDIEFLSSRKVKIASCSLSCYFWLWYVYGRIKEDVRVYKDLKFILLRLIHDY